MRNGVQLALGVARQVRTFNEEPAIREIAGTAGVFIVATAATGVTLLADRRFFSAP